MLRQPRFLSDQAPYVVPERDDDADAAAGQPLNPRDNWRRRDRMRTVSMGLVLCLNLGTDPPDVVKPHPCAHLITWLDPRPISRSKAKELIGDRLERQYGNWQLGGSTRLRCRRALDPTVNEVRNLCQHLRKVARGERALFHYNGMGVPKPTEAGEIWVFDTNHTEYVPFSVADVKQWLGTPSLVVLDCPAAAVLIPSWIRQTSDGDTASLTVSSTASTKQPTSSRSVTESLDEMARDWVQDTIVLCACSEEEMLPMHPDYPIDVFTSCLTTPIQTALRWFILQNPLTMSGVDPAAVDSLPGKSNDRRTPLGELNYIFTAVADSIAWDMLPTALFRRLFREDLLLGSMLRNFLLADRIMRTLGCTPVSHPPLPPDTSQHALWQSFDMACETILFQLRRDGVWGHVVPSKKPVTEEGEEEAAVVPAPVPTNISSPFFAEQLTAFEVWLNFSPIHRMHLQEGVDLQSPEQLPIVLQVLLSQAHRVRALHLLQRFFDLGPWAVNLALSLGIFPYVQKLLQSPEYKSLLVSIWASILSFDPSCRSELLRDGAFHHFVQLLAWTLPSPTSGAPSPGDISRDRTLAAFVLAVSCYDYPGGQSECVRLSLHHNCCALLSSYEQKLGGSTESTGPELPETLRVWLCICLGAMVRDNAPNQGEAYASGVHPRLISRLSDEEVSVRTAACFALGSLLGNPSRKGSRVPSLQDLTSTEGAVPVPTFIPPPGFGPPRFGSPAAGGPPSVISTHLPAPFAPNPANVSLQWRPQHLDPMPSIQPLASRGGPSFPPGGQPVPPGAASIPATAPYPLHLGQAPPLQPPFGMLPPQPGVGSAPTFLMGTGSPMMSPPLLAGGPTTGSAIPSVYEDSHRLAFDLDVMEAICTASTDGSVVVRYEALVSLARGVGKYLEAFIFVADDKLEATTSESNPVKRALQPEGLDQGCIDRFRRVWSVIREVQHHEPFPAVAETANKIVRVVHEQLLRFSSDTDTSDQKDLRRVVSEVVPSGRGSTTTSMEQSALLSIASGSPSSSSPGLHYKLPKSEFLDWKKSTFDLSSEPWDTSSDPMSPDGAARLYRERRKNLAEKSGRRLIEHYTPLRPKSNQDTGYDMLINEDDDQAKKEEELIANLRHELELHEAMLLRNHNVKMTSMIRFHSYEDVLVACGATDAISLWSVDSGRKLTDFLNGNPRGTGITTSTWINEGLANNLFLVGCSDGSVRIWGHLLESNGEPCQRSPSMISAFEALSTEGNERDKALVCEWQPTSGRLMAAGNSRTMRLWDLHSESVVQTFDTDSGAYVTSLATAWDFDHQDSSSKYHGLSPNVVVAGFTDGMIKLFDIRTNEPVGENRPRRRHRSDRYAEHSSWVVSTTFTGYGHELITGSVKGDVKAWDLRMSKSVRTMEVQRSQITAMAVHSKIPMIATGSHAQFIKLSTMEGDTMQVFRYHERMASHRIGPVSCLAFHRYKPLMAAGATDTYIGIYKTKKGE